MTDPSTSVIINLTFITKVSSVNLLW